MTRVSLTGNFRMDCDVKRARQLSQAARIATSMLSALLAAPGSDASEWSTKRAAVSAARTAPKGLGTAKQQHLRIDDRLGDLLHHPALTGFSRLMLPWDARAYDESMPLKNIAQLLPYHQHIEPDVVVSGLNRVIEESIAGRAVFHNIYDDAQRLAKPSLEDTGLFFLRGTPGAPFALIAPGGGFSYVGSVHEGFPYADEITKRGFNAFVLKYRVGQGGRSATEDMAAALSYVFAHAEELQVSTRHYSLWGSSAGARMAAAIGSHGTATFGQAAVPRPSAVVTAYTGHTEVAAQEPPTFVVVGELDGIAPPAAMEARIATLQRIGTRVEYHRYPDVGHGFGTGQGTRAQGWIGEAVRFWEQEIKTSR